MISTSPTGITTYRKKSKPSVDNLWSTKVSKARKINMDNPPLMGRLQLVELIANKQANLRRLEAEFFTTKSDRSTAGPD
jgi:hypothetical protein